MSTQRKRPRQMASTQLLAALIATFMTTTMPRPSQGFTLPSVAYLVAARHRNRSKSRSNPTALSAAAAARRRLQADPRQQRRRGGKENGGSGHGADGERLGKGVVLDPDDPLPRTMEEVYRRIAMEPPLNQEEQYRRALEPAPEEMEIIGEAIRTTFKCTEDDTWWEENGQEWNRMADNPGKSFAVGVDEEARSNGVVWGMEDYFGEGAPDWELFDEGPAPFSLSAYKAGGIAGLPGAAAVVRPGMMNEERRKEGAANQFGRTPFSRYWDSLPDLRTTGRVYAYNAVDRMAALKFMMNCTCNGMHGSAENHQSGHFLWGYVDQLDWMRRSGRLSGTAGSIKVDPSSWWGRVSFALTIIPLLAAVESGVWERKTATVSILGLGMGGEGRCIKDDLRLPEMRRAVRAWKRVWRFEDPDIARRVLLDMPVHDSLQERVRRAQWAAHLESLDSVETLYAEEFDKLPSEAEREFARGWCRTARLLAEAAAHTNLDKSLLTLGAGYAPERILSDKEDEDAVSSATTAKKGDRGQSDVAKAKSDSSALAQNTRRYVVAVRWLGTLRAPIFGILRRLWRQSCVSYPARRGAAKVLRNALQGGRRAKAAALGKACLFMLVPNLNYRKLTFPLGVDPAEDVEYDLEFQRRDFSKPPPRPKGSRPLNPLQWSWYDGQRPDPSAGIEEAGWGEDDDGLSDNSAGDMFPRGREPVDVSFEAMQKREREIMEDLRVAEEHFEKRQTSSRRSDEVTRGDVDATSDAMAKPEGGHGSRSNDSVFL